MAFGRSRPSTSLARGRVGATATAPKWTGRIKITGFGRDEQGARYVGLRIKRKNGARRVYLPIDDFDRSAFRRLNKLGAHIISEPARRELIERVQSRPPKGKLVIVATRVGVHGDCFVLPRKIYKPSSGSGTNLIKSIDPTVEFYSRLRLAVSAKGWKKLMRVIRRNSRMLLALGVIFVGPLALVGDFEPVAIQLVGDPGTAKTAIGAVVSTIWGYNTHPTLAAVSATLGITRQTASKSFLRGQTTRACSSTRLGYRSRNRALGSKPSCVSPPAKPKGA